MRDIVFEIMRHGYTVRDFQGPESYEFSYSAYDKDGIEVAREYYLSFLLSAVIIELPRGELPNVFHNEDLFATQWLTRKSESEI